MVEYEVVKERTIPFGKRNFIEVAQTKALFSRGEVEFISIARGYFTQEDEKKYRNRVTLPMDTAVLHDLMEELKGMMEDLEKSGEYVDTPVE